MLNIKRQNHYLNLSIRKANSVKKKKPIVVLLQLPEHLSGHIIQFSPELSSS